MLHFLGEILGKSSIWYYVLYYCSANWSSTISYLLPLDLLDLGIGSDSFLLAGV